MTKHWLKKPWALTGLIFLFIFVISFIFTFISEFFGVGGGRSTFLSVLAIMAVGMMYTNKFKKVMPKKLKIQVTTRYIGIQASFILFVLMFLNFDPILTIILLILIPIFALLTYFLLGFGSKIVINSLKK